MLQILDKSFIRERFCVLMIILSSEQTNTEFYGKPYFNCFMSIFK